MASNGTQSAAAISVQPISLPKGGGALTGIGEMFSADEFTGAAALSLPLPSSIARGFEPELALSYSSGGGNGPFGLGVSLALPAISLRTGKGIPQYRGDDGIIFSGSGDLVPIEGSTRSILAGGISYEVTRFAPRVESDFDLIERWVDSKSGATAWRVLDRHGVTSLFGRSAAGRISDPSDASKIFAWLLEASFDTSGNAFVVDYLPENADNVPNAIYEQGRTQTANKYPGSVRFGNVVPYVAPPYGIGPLPEPSWHFEIVFDYGQYDPSPANDTPYRPVRLWPARADAVSTYAAGFEIRTHRLCRNVLLFHRFDVL